MVPRLCGSDTVRCSTPVSEDELMAERLPVIAFLLIYVLGARTVHRWRPAGG
jgi:hypothetical protein